MSKIFCKTVFLSVSTPPMSWKVTVISGAMPASLAMKASTVKSALRTVTRNKGCLLVVSQVGYSQDSDLGVPAHLFVQMESHIGIP